MEQPSKQLVPLFSKCGGNIGEKAPASSNIARSSNGLIKIGLVRRAVCLGKRLQQLRRETKTEIELLVTFPGSFQEEQRLLRRFKSLNDHGEWFRAERSLNDFISLAREASVN